MNVFQKLSESYITRVFIMKLELFESFSKRKINRILKSLYDSFIKMILLFEISRTANNSNKIRNVLNCSNVNIYIT